MKVIILQMCDETCLKGLGERGIDQLLQLVTVETKAINLHCTVGGNLFLMGVQQFCVCYG
jgi:hypothetical protein